MTERGTEDHGDMDHDDISLGEVGRRLGRLENAVQVLGDKMIVALGPVGEIRVHIENAKQDINELWSFGRSIEKRINSVELRAAGVAGGICAIAFLVKFLLGK